MMFSYFVKRGYCKRIRQCKHFNGCIFCKNFTHTFTKLHSYVPSNFCLLHLFAWQCNVPFLNHLHLKYSFFKNLPSSKMSCILVLFQDLPFGLSNPRTPVVKVSLVPKCLPPVILNLAPYVRLCYALASTWIPSLKFGKSHTSWWIQHVFLDLNLQLIYTKDFGTEKKVTRSCAIVLDFPVDEMVWIVIWRMIDHRILKTGHSEGRCTNYSPCSSSFSGKKRQLKNAAM